jgi:hypothetical protein
MNKELANIRSKFKGDKTLDGYQKKKYVCKLLFIFLLGHDIDFGHMEAVNLLSSNKYSEKQIVSLELYYFIIVQVLISIFYEFLGLSLHFRARQHEQRSDKAHHSKYQKRFAIAQPDSCKFGIAMHCEYRESRYGRGICK